MDGQHRLETPAPQVNPSPVRAPEHRVELLRLQRPNLRRLSRREPRIKLAHAPRQGSPKFIRRLLLRSDWQLDLAQKTSVLYNDELDCLVLGFDPYVSPFCSMLHVYSIIMSILFWVGMGDWGVSLG